MDHAIARLAEGQHGVVSREQLRKLGLSDREISLRVERGSLHSLFRGTFAVGHLLIDRSGRMLAAVLACGERTVISHGSAAELLGLWEKQLPVVDVIPPSWSGRKIDGIRWHRVRLPRADEIEIRDGVPCTTVSRTLVDMVARTGWGSMRRLVEQAAVLRALDVEEIDRILALGRRRGAPRLRAILVPWRSTLEQRPVLRSRLEARLLPRLIEEGLPAPRCNAKLRIDGHRFEVDLLWKEQRLAIEADGEQTHGTPTAFQHDRFRDQVLIAAGYRTARVTWSQVRDEPTAVVSRIARMLKRR
ncbi:MAG TPA: type IV toxin-antitoxin system AbiEi family antitoxin domain-containing protein [Solirubrobacterales bacterium]|nr:type IV toxin-antitoxin system AbiEi family antitoxin domain-containing protein [Solirubrobacterales bacterium]